MHVFLGAWASSSFQKYDSRYNMGKQYISFKDGCVPSSQSHQNEIAKQSRGENLSMLMYKTVSQTVDSNYGQFQLLIR